MEHYTIMFMKIKHFLDLSSSVDQTGKESGHYQATLAQDTLKCSHRALHVA